MAERRRYPESAIASEAKILYLRILPRDLLLLSRSEMMALIAFVCSLNCRPCSSEICPPRVCLLSLALLLHLPKYPWLLHKEKTAKSFQGIVIFS